MKHAALRFDPCWIGLLRKGDTLLVPTSPGSVTVSVYDIRLLSGNRLAIDVCDGSYDEGMKVTKGACLSLHQADQAMVLRPAGYPRPVEDQRRVEGWTSNYRRLAEVA